MKKLISEIRRHVYNGERDAARRKAVALLAMLRRTGGSYHHIAKVEALLDKVA